MRTNNLRSAFTSIVTTVTCLAGFAFITMACQTNLTEAVVVNEFSTDGGAPLTVYRAWYRSTLYLDPIAPGTRSEALRVGAGAEVAYALLAPGYDPEVGPSRLVVARTKEVVETRPGDTSTIVFSEQTAFIGCGSSAPLSREDSEFIMQRIFPGELANLTYDAKSCAATPLAVDGGVDDGAAPDEVNDAAGASTRQ